MAEWLNVLNILTSNLTELAEHVKSPLRSLRTTIQLLDVQPSVLVWTNNQMQSSHCQFSSQIFQVFSHQDGQSGRDSAAPSSSAGGTAASSSASTVFTTKKRLNVGHTKRVWPQYVVNWSKRGHAKRVWSQYFVNWCKGGRVRPRSSYDVKH
jgi:hypothetical protein